MRIFLDANVLYSIRDSDVVLILDEAGFIQVAFSDYVEREAIKNLLLRRSDLRPNQVVSRFEMMRTEFESSRIDHIERPDPCYGLPDSNDEQVLFDAVRAGATHLLTYNLKDFPEAIATQQGITVWTPTQLFNYLAEHIDRTALALIIDEWRRVKSRPPISRAELLADFDARGWLRLSEQIREAWES